MSDAEVIHCYCKRLRKKAPWHHQHPQFSRVLAVLLPDGRLELRQDGKSGIVAGGTVALACSKCGFEREISLGVLTEPVAL